MVCTNDAHLDDTAELVALDGESTRPKDVALALVEVEERVLQVSMSCQLRKIRS